MANQYPDPNDDLQAPYQQTLYEAEPEPQPWQSPFQQQYPEPEPQPWQSPFQQQYPEPETQPYQPQPYQQPYQQPCRQPAAPQPNTLVYGILSMVFCFIAGIFIGLAGRKKGNEYIAAGGTLTGASKVGYILCKAGIILTIATTAYLILYAVFMILMFSL